MKLAHCVSTLNNQHVLKIRSHLLLLTFVLLVLLARSEHINMSIISLDNINAFFNPLKGRGNYIATLNNMKLVHWPLMGGLLHLVQR